MVMLSLLQQKQLNMLPEKEDKVENKGARKYYDLEMTSHEIINRDFSCKSFSCYSNTPFIDTTMDRDVVAIPTF